MYYPRGVFACFILGAIIFMSGCGNQGRTSVSGNVAINGKPIEKGTINFVSVGQTKGSPAWGEIVDGVYSIEKDKGPQLGAYRVEIRAPRNTGRFRPAKPPVKPTEIWVESIPKRYNSQSELQVELKENENTCNFILTSK